MAKKNEKKANKKAVAAKNSRLGKSGVNMHDFVMAIFKKSPNATEEQVMSAVQKEFPNWEPKKYYGIWRREAGLKAVKKATAKKTDKKADSKKAKKSSKKAEHDDLDEGESVE